MGAIPEGENYKGRWTAARSAIRMYDAAAAFDKAEVFFSIHRKLPLDNSLPRLFICVLYEPVLHHPAHAEFLPEFSPSGQRDDTTMRCRTR